MNRQKKGTPAWVWIGCGCVLCIVLFIAAVGGLGFAGVSWVKGMVDDMADPQARTAAALDMLGAETLPEGYHARAFFNVPFIMRLLILSDGEPPGPIEGEDFEAKAEQLENLVVRSENMGKNTLFYLKLRDRDREPIEAILAGRAGGGADIDLGVEFDIFAELGDGELTVGEQPIVWRAHQVEMETVGGRHPGIFAAVQVSCNGGEDIHDFLWFQTLSEPPAAERPAPFPETSAEGGTEIPSIDDGVELVDPEAEPRSAGPPSAGPPTMSEDDLAGSPADPEALAELLGYFHLCGL